ncbi:ABC transporter ATP-binding protein [Actinobacteria bacterium YIM 96077]|uniref:ABC transporter ATP-binding protein n=2 Tax=Phytoactinopolyspora halophila TaxID=1981511 RepID=A0A329QR46_9ACTN|nr:ABC transporter ATP-binding protein [Actinobacteria bacterium YIM 96077]RAW13842.1 ABC transporter ATP-binding protein [Phytoactinopolyspora halophila]
MEIKRGQIYGFVGQNGAGKSTLIRLLTGAAQPTDGEIELFGKTGARDLARVRSRTGCIIDGPAVAPGLTARQNLEVLRLQRGLPGGKYVDEALERVGLMDTGKKPAKDFSMGMRQRLAIAIAMLGDPEFLILDEPTNGLDPTWIIQIREELTRLNKEKDVTILVSSHVLAELHKLATVYGFIHRGQMVEQISAAQLDERCRSYLCVQTDDPERTSTILEETLKVTDYRVGRDNLLMLTDFIDEPERVADAIVREGIALKSLYVQGDSLEDYFSRLIGGVERA